MVQVIPKCTSLVRELEYLANYVSRCMSQWSLKVFLRISQMYPDLPNRR
jgi:hypothetical protein